MHGKILIVDDTATNRIVLKVRLAANYYVPLQARSAAEALRILASEPLDLVILGTSLPDMAVDRLVRAMRGRREGADLPLLMIAGADDRALVIAAFDAGLDDCLTRPVSDDVLLARVRGLMRLRDASAPLVPTEACSLQEGQSAYQPAARVALVADRPETALRWRAALAPHMPDRIEISSREDALNPDVGGSADLFVIAADLGAAGGTSAAMMAGMQLMRDLRCRAATRDAALCIVLPPTAQELAVAALDLGADGVLSSGFDGPEAAARLRALIRRKLAGDQRRAALRRGLELSLTDPLTGLHNRRFALPALARMRAMAAQDGAQTAVMIIDVDRFKSVNDRFGHAAGDAVLVELARRLMTEVGEIGLLARIGGEEFLLAARTVDASAAKTFADRLCRTVERDPILLPNGAGALRVTVSIGLAVVGPGCGLDEGTEQVLHRADCALMTAKGGGRNRVTLSRSAA